MVVQEKMYFVSQQSEVSRGKICGGIKKKMGDGQKRIMINVDTEKTEDEVEK